MRFIWQVFVGNSDRSTVVTATFPAPLIARVVKLRPRRDYGPYAMRFEVLGCDASGSNSGQLPLGVRGNPKDGHSFVCEQSKTLRTQSAELIIAVNTPKASGLSPSLFYNDNSKDI